MSKKKSQVIIPENAVKISADDCLNFFKADVETFCQGVLYGLHERKGKQKGTYFQIRLTQPCDSIVSPADNELGTKKFVQRTAEPGTMVNVDYRSALKKMVEFVDEPGKHEFLIHFKDKIGIDGGRTFWRADTYLIASNQD